DKRVNTQPIWWEVRPVLVMSQSDWPTADGSSGITSSTVMDDVEAANRAIEVGSNFFLFFSSRMGATTEQAHVHSFPGPAVAADQPGSRPRGKGVSEAGTVAGERLRLPIWHVCIRAELL